MPDDVTTAPTTPTTNVTETPAAPTVTPPADPPAAKVDTRPADPPAAAQSKPADPPAPKKDEAPQADDDADGVDFDIAGWDGKLDTLPPELRPLGDAMHGHLSKAHKAVLEERDAALRDLQDLRAVADALLSGQEDPRVKTLTGERDDFKTKFSAIEKEKSDISRELAELNEQLTQFYKDDAKRSLDRLKTAAPDLFKDEDKGLDQVLAWLEAGWEWSDMEKLASLDAKQLDVASAAIKDGTPTKYALQLAEGTPAEKPRKESPSAKMVSGADGTTARPSAIRTGGNRPASYNESRDNAIANALAKRR